MSIRVQKAANSKEKTILEGGGGRVIPGRRGKIRRRGNTIHGETCGGPNIVPYFKAANSRPHLKRGEKW